ncbi:17380_t:CDS:2, partial [Entrophospora sp. SA101]
MKSKFITCSEKVWNDVCPISLTPKTLPSIVNQMIIEYSLILDEKWHGNWSKWNELSTKEDKDMFDCAQIVARNLKSDFQILSKIRGTNKEILFGEVKPPHVKSSMNESIVKITEFMKGSLDYLIDCYGYIDGLETYGMLIYGNTIRIFTMDLVYDGLYHFNLTSKILLPMENANFLTIITVISTLYSLLERIKSTVVVINSNSPQHLLERTISITGVPDSIHIAVFHVGEELAKHQNDRNVNITLYRPQPRIIYHQAAAAAPSLTAGNPFYVGLPPAPPPYGRDFLPGPPPGPLSAAHHHQPPP